MGKVRYGFALFMAKLSIPALKVTGHNATDFPGQVALKICPDFLKYIKKPEKIIGITGTNGKTSITNLVVSALKELGIDPVSNIAGSNTVTGVTTSLLKNYKLFGSNKGRTAVLEIDERSTRLICPYVKPDLMVVSNLSRDSIMRNGHPQFIRNILNTYMPEKTKLIINADDLNAVLVAPENERVYYGIGPMAGDLKESRNIINDVPVCPNCKSKLKFDYIRYSNIGRVHCDCGYEAPAYDYAGVDVDPETNTMNFEFAGEKTKVNLINTSVFNIYNQVATTAVLCEMGYDPRESAKLVEKLALTKTRLNNESVGGIEVYTMLCKGINGYAASRVFEYIGQQDQVKPKEIIYMGNDVGLEKTWCEDICWVYDCDFEMLAKDWLSQIFVYGARAYDYKVRLLIAGVPEEKIKIVKSPEAAVKELKLEKGEQIFVLHDTTVIKEGLELAEEIKSEIKEKQGL